MSTLGILSSSVFTQPLTDIHHPWVAEFLWLFISARSGYPRILVCDDFSGGVAPKWNHLYVVSVKPDEMKDPCPTTFVFKGTRCYHHDETVVTMKRPWVVNVHPDHRPLEGDILPSEFLLISNTLISNTLDGSDRIHGCTMLYYRPGLQLAFVKTLVGHFVPPSRRPHENHRTLW